MKFVDVFWCVKFVRVCVCEPTNDANRCKKHMRTNTHTSILTFSHTQILPHKYFHTHTRTLSHSHALKERSGLGIPFKTTFVQMVNLKIKTKTIET